jgi:hypothetical protein
VRGDAWVCLAQSIMPVAATAVLAGVLRHPGADRVEFNVAHAGEQVGLGLDHAGFVAPFP